MQDATVNFLIFLNNELINKSPETYKQIKADYERNKTKENDTRAKKSVE